MPNVVARKIEEMELNRGMADTCFSPSFSELRAAEGGEGGTTGGGGILSACFAAADDLSSSKKKKKKKKKQKKKKKNTTQGGRNEMRQQGGEGGMLFSPILPGLDDETAARCMAFVPRSSYGALSLVSTRLRDLIRGGYVYELRARLGMVEQWVYMFANGDRAWKVFDPKRCQWMRLPPCPADYSFAMADKESLSAGTHLLWMGWEHPSYIVFRYELTTNKWGRGPPMNNPRCLFASASCGNTESALVAGGNCDGKVLKSAEKYNARTQTWELLPDMHTARQKASGCYLNGQFYVIGGRNEAHLRITSGEVYNPITNDWRIIEDMCPPPEGRERMESSPPLVAVVANNLFAIDSSINTLKLYNQTSNEWTTLGSVPVRADFHNGWGLAFKAVGDELYVIGGYKGSDNSEGMAMFSWKPQLNNSKSPNWTLVTAMYAGTGNFLNNCAVMSC